MFASWRKMLLDVMTLKADVSSVGRDVENLELILRDVDKRLVRLEALAEFEKRSADATKLSEEKE